MDWAKARTASHLPTRRTCLDRCGAPAQFEKRFWRDGDGDPEPLRQ